MALRKQPRDSAPAAPQKSTPAGSGGKNGTGRGGASGRGGGDDRAGRSTADRGAAAAKTSGRGAAAPSAAQGTGFRARLSQLRLVFAMTRKRDPQVLWITLAGLGLPLALGIVLGLFVGPLYVWIPIGLLLGVVVALNLFSRRVQRTAYAEMEGKPGAAAGVVERMRGDWRITPAVGINRNQDVVHRVVSRAGVVIIAEGRGRGPRELLAAEKRRIRKVVGDTPITDIIVGTGEGETPLPKLQSTLMRMRRALRRGEVDALDRRLRAMGGAALPIPKGPIPRNIPRGGRPR
ncbi:putative integral membrane protein [Frankia sp. AiPs1]|uniref:DUF4191 domain-containing protein n=1 Tax=Frankia sp. AiPa1 TaxID=573492 RepID=UPI00202B758C|nr:DUF4191 domain-containing protein [Frankia sp. AiPa1]MCL9759590.1 DUF4191 domain-containing protein [Frankia sp. AiPa1]